MKEQIHKFLTKPIVIIITVLTSALLTYLTGGLGYFFGITVALILLWASKFKWKDFGIGKPQWMKTALSAFVLAILIYILIDILIQPLIEIYLGIIDLSALDGIRGNFISYIIFILFMWVFAAVGEEFLYRGFFMRQLAIIFGDTNKSWLVSAIAISILFGMAHLYQGLSGMITTGLVGLCLSLVYYKNRNNLILTMLIHGFYDIIGITLIFLNQERVIIDWLQSHIIG